MGFGELCWTHLGVKCKDRSNILGQVWPSWALLRKLQLCFLGARLGDLEGKLSYPEVMLKLSWAMSCHVEAICQILFGHVVGFASRNAPPSRTKILSGFRRAMLAPFRGQVQLSYGHVGAILGPTSAILGLVLKAVWDHFGPCCFGVIKNNPPIQTPQNQIKN